MENGKIKNMELKNVVIDGWKEKQITLPAHIKCIVSLDTVIEETEKAVKISATVISSYTDSEEVVKFWVPRSALIAKDDWLKRMPANFGCPYEERDYKFALFYVKPYAEVLADFCKEHDIDRGQRRGDELVKYIESLGYTAPERA